MNTATPPPNGPDERAYHHGDLRRSLIAAALQLVEEQGLEAVSVREVARRVGVSAGAPFRHSENGTPLRTAVAEEAQDRLLQAWTMPSAHARLTIPWPCSG